MKKKYIQPQNEIVKLHARTSLLDGSLNVNLFSSQDYDSESTGEGDGTY